MGVTNLRKPRHVGRPAQNLGVALDLDWLAEQRVNRSATERRIQSLSGWCTVKTDWQAAWLLRALTCIDLTMLDGGDTSRNIARLCAKARRPLRGDLAAALGAESLNVAAVCVYPLFVEEACEALAGSGIPVAADFPDGLTKFEQRLDEVREFLRRATQVKNLWMPYGE